MKRKMAKEARATTTSAPITGPAIQALLFVPGVVEGVFVGIDTLEDEVCDPSMCQFMLLIGSHFLFISGHQMKSLPVILGVLENDVIETSPTNTPQSKSNNAGSRLK